MGEVSYRPRISSSLAELEGTKILCFPGSGLTAETAQGYSGQPVEVNGSSSGPIEAAENGWLPNLNMEGLPLWSLMILFWWGLD